MIELNIQVGEEIAALIAFPKHNMEQMFNIASVVGNVGLLQDSVKANFHNQKNIDGSTWKPWSEYTAALRARGIVQRNPLRRGQGSLLRATGRYYDTLTNDILGIASSFDAQADLFGSMHQTIKYNKDKNPRLENEHEHKETFHKNVTPARQVLFWNDKAIDNILAAVVENIDNYWSR